MLRAICSKKNLAEIAYYECIKDIIESEEIIKLKNITHHISTTRFQHCLNVSYYNYVICGKLGLDAVSAARAGLMHDLSTMTEKNLINQNQTKPSLTAFFTRLWHLIMP